MPVTVTIDDLGTLLRVWRTQRGLTIRDVADRASDLLPGRETVTHTTVARYEGNHFPEAGPNKLYLAAITKALDHRLGDLPDEYEEEMATTEALTKRTCSSGKVLAAA